MILVNTSNEEPEGPPVTLFDLIIYFSKFIFVCYDSMIDSVMSVVEEVSEPK